MLHTGVLCFQGAEATVAVRGLSSVVVYCCKARALGTRAHSLWCQGLATLRRVGPLQTRHQACVLCMGRQSLNHWTSRDAQAFFFLFSAFCVMLRKPLATPELQMKL